MIEINQEHIQALKLDIERNQKFLISTHSNPDGDTVGASLAIAQLLLQMGKDVMVVAPDDIPDFLQWIPGADSIVIYKDEHKKVQSWMDTTDLVFCMDFNAPHRVGKMVDVLERMTCDKILIDHHLYPDESFFKLMFSFPEYSSTSELMLEIIRKASYLDYLNADMATALFVGIMTDTGSFAHSANRKEVFEAVALLIEKTHINVKQIHDRIFNNFKENRLRFLGYCINEKLVVRPEYKTAYFTVSLEEMERFQVAEGDLEGLVNYALSIAGIEFAILMKEKEDRIKLSFRSKSSFSVNQFARDYFEGGGHFNAAGGKSKLSLAETVAKLEKLLAEIEI